MHLTCCFSCLFVDCIDEGVGADVVVSVDIVVVCFIIYTTIYRYNK